MFNGYNETTLTSFNEFNHDEREKKQEDVSKWSYGHVTGTQSVQSTSHRQPEFWSGKPNFLGISKCNCSGCYPSSENHSYQGESTRHRPWLPRSYTVPLNGFNESCKLPVPGYHHWDNLNLQSQSSCLSDSNVQYVQESGGKHPLYKHYQNSRLFEGNQPGVITLVKDLKKDGLLKQKNDMTQEAMFHEQNETRQSMFYHPGYNPQRNSEKRYEGKSCNSNYHDPNDKYSNLEFYKHPVNMGSYSVDQHATRIPVVEPYIKAVPSNQTRVPSIDHRNVKENLPQSYADQCYNDSKLIYSEQESNVGEKNTRLVYQSTMGKEGTGNFPMVQVHGLPSPMDLKSNEAHVNHRPFNMTMPCGNIEQQKLLFNNRHDFFPRNVSDTAKRNSVTPVGDIRKDCAVGQVNMVDQRYTDSKPNHLSKYLGNSKGLTGGFYYTGEKISKTEKLDLQENSSCHSSNPDVLKNDTVRFPRSAVIYNDPRFVDKTQNSFPYQSVPGCKSLMMRSEYSYQGYNTHGRYDGSSMTAIRHRNDPNQYKISQQQTPSCGVDQFLTQGNNAFFLNSPYELQQLGSSDKVPSQQLCHDKNQLPAQLESPVLQNHSEDTRPLEIRKPNNYLETIRCEDINKSGSSKISPLRLLRKKKFINQRSDNVSETAPAVNLTEAAPALDVRKFWSTWAEEEEENVSPTQMIVLDCQNIDPEQAKLLHLYESDPIRAVNLEGASIVTLKNSDSTEDSREREELKSFGDNFPIQNCENVADAEIKTFGNGSLCENNSQTTANVPSEPTNRIINNTLSMVSVESQNVPEEVTKSEAKPCKKGRLSAPQEFKEANRHKVRNLEKKADEFSRLDKWTEKKFDFLKRAEESRAAEILRHEEEKKKIFERRLSFQQVVNEVKKPKITSRISNSPDSNAVNAISDDLKERDIYEKVPARLSPFDENSKSNSPNEATFTDLPTSEYRRNKFLDYSDGNVIVGENHKTLEEKGCVKDSQGKIIGCDILHEPPAFEMDEVKKEKIKVEHQNWSLIDKHSVGKLGENKFEYPVDINVVKLKNEAGVEMEDILRKMSEINFRSPNCKHEENCEKAKNEKQFQSKKKTKSKKIEGEEESDRDTEKMTLENISKSKPTIKFSIQKSHDLKISFKVLNSNSKKYASDEGGGRNEIESEENSVDNSKSSTEMITLKLKGFQRGGSNCERNFENVDYGVKNKRKLRRKKERNDRKTPVLRIRKSRYIREEEKDPLAVDNESCLNLSKKLYTEDHSSDFQVQETVDSAKIKLTFKRHKGGNYTEYKINQNCVNKFCSGQVKAGGADDEEIRSKKKSKRERSRHQMLPQSNEESIQLQKETISDSDSCFGGTLNDEDSQNCESEGSDCSCRGSHSSTPVHFLEILPDAISVSANPLNEAVEERSSTLDSNENPVKEILRDVLVLSKDKDLSKTGNDVNGEDIVLFENEGKEIRQDSLMNKGDNSDVIGKEYNPEPVSPKKLIFAEVEVSTEEISLDFNRNIKEVAKETNSFDCESKVTENGISQILTKHVSSIDTKLNAKEIDENVCISTNQINHSEVNKSSCESKLEKDENKKKICLTVSSDEGNKKINKLNPLPDLDVEDCRLVNIEEDGSPKNFVIPLEDVENSVQLNENVNVYEEEREGPKRSNYGLCEEKNEENVECFEEEIGVMSNNEDLTEYDELSKEHLIIKDDGLERNSFHCQTGSAENKKDCDDRGVDLVEPDKTVVDLNSKLTSPEEIQTVQEESMSARVTPSLGEDPYIEKPLNEIITGCSNLCESPNWKETVVDVSFETIFQEIPTHSTVSERIKENGSNIEDGEIIDDDDDDAVTIEDTSILKQSEDKEVILSATKFEMEKNNKKNVICANIRDTKKSHIFLKEMCQEKRKIIYRRHSTKQEFNKSDKITEFRKFTNDKNTKRKVTVMKFRAKSCPPGLKFTDEVKALKPNISVEDIPLPPGDPLPENCFDFEKYFKQKAQDEANSQSFELVMSRIIENNGNASKIVHPLTENKEKSDDSKMSSDLPLVPSEVKHGSNSSPPLTEESGQNDTEKESVENLVLPRLDKNFKVSFSIQKRRKLNSIVSKIDEEEFNGRNKKKVSATIIDNCKNQMTVKSSEKSDFKVKEIQKKNSKSDEFEKKDNEKTRLFPFLNFETFHENESISSDSLERNILESNFESKPECGDFKVGTHRVVTELSKFETVEVDEIEESEVPKDVAAKVEIKEEPLLGFENNECVGDEFYECEDIPTSEDLPNEDDESEKVSDDDKFRNIMQNCLDNAKKFLNVGNLKLFSCSVDDLLELDCSNVEENDEKLITNSNNHISRDVLLTSCEDGSDDLGLSKNFQPVDMSMDFVPSFCNEGAHNLCPEILPVDNWPYLEEEVPSSPTKSKTEDTDLIPSLEKVSEGQRRTKIKDTNGKEVLSFYISNHRNRLGDFRDRMDKLSSREKCRRLFLPGIGAENFKRVRRRSLIMDGEIFRCSSLQRRKTIDGFTGSLFSCQKPAKEIERKNGVEGKLEKDGDLKCKLSLEKLTGRIQTENKGLKFRESEENTPRAFLKGINGSVNTKGTRVNLKRKSLLDYKSPCWQPKVILFRISKNQLKSIYKNSHIDCTERESNGRGEISAVRIGEATSGFVKENSSLDSSVSVELNKLCEKPNSPVQEARDESKCHKKMTVLKASSEQEVKTNDKEGSYLNESKIDLSVKGSLSSKKFEIRKKRFRNLHSKKKGEQEWIDKTKIMNPTVQVTPKVSTLVITESESLRIAELPKESVFNSNKEGWNCVKSESRKSSEEKNPETCFSITDYRHGVRPKIDVSFLSNKNKLVKKSEDRIRESEHSHSRENSKHKRCYDKHDSRSKEEKERERVENPKQRRESSHDRNKQSKKDGQKHSRSRRDSQRSEVWGSDVKEKRRKKEASPETPWICEVCGFNNATERMGHIKSHPFHCQSCHLAFKTEACFVTHLTKKHKDIRNQHHCLLCELSFDTEIEYQKHLETREHRHLESVEKNTINTLFTLLTGQPCPVLGLVEMKPEWLPNQAGTVHFYHQATPLSLALQYLKMHHDLTSYSTVSSAHPKF